MSEQLKESLSAVLDDAADEFELRRVLDETRRNDALRDTFGRYQLVKSVLRGETSAQTLRHRNELQRRIRESFEEEPSTDLQDEAAPVPVENVPGKSRWSMRVGAAAAAFVAVLAVYFAGFNPETTQQEPLVAQRPNAPLDTTVVGTGASTDVSGGLRAQSGLSEAANPVDATVDVTMDSTMATTSAAVVLRHQQLLERHRAGAQNGVAPVPSSPSIDVDGASP